MKIPWKIKRELLRVVAQIRDLLFFLPDALRCFIYSKKKYEVIKKTKGKKVLKNKIAIFLIYQPKSLAKSIFLTLDYLNNAGYSVFLVSNSNLSSIDRDALLMHTNIIFERPNFGYDFGGYKDAYLYIIENNLSVERLILLNDSIWFLISPQKDLIRQMEQSNTDFTGALEVDGGRYLRGKNNFYASFFLMFSNNVINHSDFNEFWRDYRYSNSKSITIRNGERKLSKCVLSIPNVTSAAMITRSKLNEVALNLIENGNNLFLSDLVQIAVDGSQLKISPEENKDNPFELFKKITHHKNFLSSATILCLEHLSLSFLKKSSDPHNLYALQNILSKILEEQLSINQTIQLEIRDHVTIHNLNRNE